MQTIEIEGVQYSLIDDIIANISFNDQEQRELDSLNYEIETLKESLEVEKKARERHEKIIQMTEYIMTKYSDIKNIDAFIELCKSSDALTTKDIDRLYAILPAQAKSNKLKKFFKFV